MNIQPAPRGLRDVDAEIPAGAFTIEEYSATHGLNYKTAVSRLTAMMRNGEVAMGRFVSSDLLGRRCAKRWYIVNRGGPNAS